MQKNKWMPGNLNPDYQIKEKDAGLHNVVLRRILVPPNDAKHPITREWVKCFRLVDYNKYFVNCSQEQKQGYLESMHVDSAELVHDPTKGEPFKGSPVPTPQPGPKTSMTQKERLQKQAEELNIEGWELMSVPKLRNAINAAK